MTDYMRIWNMTDKELIDELSRPTQPDDRAAHLVLKVSIARILTLLTEDKGEGGE